MLCGEARTNWLLENCHRPCAGWSLLMARQVAWDQLLLDSSGPKVLRISYSTKARDCSHDLALSFSDKSTSVDQQHASTLLIFLAFFVVLLLHHVHVDVLLPAHT
jgi:hypothetical protein